MLHVVAWFEHGTTVECDFVCETATDLLVTFNDREARKALSETMGRPEAEPLLEIPNDALAMLLQVPLESLRAARRTGCMDSNVHVGRTVGRRPSDRTSFLLSWFPSRHYHVHPEGYLEDPHLSVSISLSDMPRGHDGARGFVERLFRRAAKSGECWYAGARLYPSHHRNWGGGYVELHEPPDLSEVVNQRLWAAMLDRRRAFVPGIRHAQLLSRVHLEALGGRDAFLKSIREFAALDLPLHPPKGVVMANGMACVWADDQVLRSEPDDIRIDSMAVVGPDEGAAWLACRFAQAGLFVLQANDALDALSSSHKRKMSSIEQSRSQVASTPRDGLVAELEAREKKFDEFMQRLWASPPRFIASVAHPVGNAQRSALGRSRGGHGENMTAFRVSRTSDDEPVGLWGPISSRGEFWYPYFIGGPTVATALAVFDPNRVGFDAENGLRERRSPRKTPDAYHCVRCGHDRFHVTVMFEYGEPEEDEPQAMRDRPEDFFSWFILNANCAGCKHRTEVASVECA